MIRRLPVKMTNPTVGILISRLLGVELHAPIFSDRFDHSRQPLLKALIFTLFQNFDYQVLIFHHDLHFLYVHFKEKCNSTHLCLIMISYHYCIMLEQGPAATEEAASFGGKISFGGKKLRQRYDAVACFQLESRDGNHEF